MKPDSQNQVENVLTFDAPCCESVRECSVRKMYVLAVGNRPRILRTIDAVRCSRGIRKKVKFYPSPNVLLVEYYRSNRGVNYVYVIWKPQNMTEEQAKELAVMALGLFKEEEVA